MKKRVFSALQVDMIPKIAFYVSLCQNIFETISIATEPRKYQI